MLFGNAVSRDVLSTIITCFSRDDHDLIVSVVLGDTSGRRYWDAYAAHICFPSALRARHTLNRNQPAQPVLFAIPVGTGIRGALRARGASTISAWGLSNPFDHAAVAPAVPAGVQIQ